MWKKINLTLFIIKKIEFFFINSYLNLSLSFQRKTKIIWIFYIFKNKLKIVREWNSTQSIILNHGCLPSKFKKKGKFIRGCPYNASQYLVVVLCAKNLNSDYLIGSSEYSNFCHMSLSPKTPKMVINESSTFISDSGLLQIKKSKKLQQRNLAWLMIKQDLSLVRNLIRKLDSQRHAGSLKIIKDRELLHAIKFNRILRQ